MPNSSPGTVATGNPPLPALSTPFTRSRGFVILLGSLAAFDPLSIDMYLPAFPSIQKDLHTTIGSVELSLTSFFVGMAAGQLVYGPLADRFGRRKPLVFGMILYFLATIGCAFAPNIASLILLRILQAFGGCAGMVITGAIVRDLFDRQRAAHFFSSLMLVMGIAPMIAPLAGGYINQLLGWRWIFGILALAILLCLICVTILLPETQTGPPGQLHPGFILKNYWELLRARRFIGYVLPDATGRAAMFAYIAGSPFVFIELLHVRPQYYGWIFGANVIGMISASQINRLLLRTLSSDQILRGVIPATATAGLVLFALAFHVRSLWSIVIPLFIFLMLMGFISPNSAAGALESQGHRAGMASALYGTLQWSIATFSSYAVSRLHNGTALPMTGVIFICGLISLLSFEILAVHKSSTMVVQGR